MSYVGPCRVTPFDLILVDVRDAYVFCNVHAGYLDCPRCRVRHEFSNLRAGFTFWFDCECGFEMFVEVTR